MLNILFVFAVGMVGVATADFSRKLSLSVYYESACPDSKAYIINQLQPAMNLLQDYLDLQLVPFGKARSINNGFGGFRCQHGQPECLGNMIQDCTLNLMSSRSDMEKVKYIVCEMQTKSSTRGDLNCVFKSNVPGQLVEACVSSNQGMGLQLKSEYLTKLVQPTFIPTTTFDGIFNQKLQDSSIADLIGTLCSIFKDAPPCAEYYNNQALMSMMG